jgi:ferrous iron transport protein B
MISLMEDTGYMARAAFIMDKLMHRIGLHGKSFIPLIMGFGCNVPAIMATRTIESRNDRLLTMMIVPFMSCSARLPVYVLLITAFFPGWSGSMLFFIYLFGILVAILSALVLKGTLFREDEFPFVMELPPYRRPYLTTTLKHMWEKGVEYLKKIGGIILVASIIIWALGRFPMNQELSRDYEKAKALISIQYEEKINTTSMTMAERKNISDEKDEILYNLDLQKESERLEKSYIGKIGHFIEPVVAPLGFDWKMGVSLVTGLAAKEIVVSTMGVLYQVEEADLESQKLVDRLRNQIGRNEQGKAQKLQALSFIIFILLYFPCIGVIAAIRRESESWFWPFFSAIYTTGVAWIISFIIYQGGRIILL